jgi:uncharacterized membrane protein
MSSTRLEAFSDGVITITIMVLELKVPQGETLSALAPVLPVFLSYVLVAILWLVPDRRIENALAAHGQSVDR